MSLEAHINQPTRELAMWLHETFKAHAEANGVVVPESFSFAFDALDVPKRLALLGVAKELKIADMELIGEVLGEVKKRLEGEPTLDSELIERLIGSILRIARVALIG